MFSTSKDVFQICDSFLPLEHVFLRRSGISSFQVSANKKSDRLGLIPLEGAWSQLIESSKSREYSKHDCGLQVRAKTILTHAYELLAHD